MKRTYISKLQEHESPQFEKDSFIEAVRELPCLWDVNCPEYKDRNIKNNAWKQLSVMFGEEGEVYFW